MITYNDLDEAVRKERSNPKELQLLPKNFLDEISNYLKEKKEFSMKNSDDFSDSVMKTKKQLENARTRLKELIRLRRKKILDLLLIATETGISKKDFDNMFDFEKEMFEGMMKCVDSTENQINNFFNGKSENPSVENDKQRIVFIEKADEFMDLDGNMLGPFSKGDKAELPKEIVKILVEDKKVYIE